MSDPNPPAPAASPRAASRDPFFDNAKMLLVTLVVVGHSWTLVPDASSHSAAYLFLYLWHVPAFVMVTGYLSRRFTLTRANLRRLLTTVVVPYVVFETLLALFRTLVGGEHLGMLYLNPHWPMWYLTALLLWRLATPLLTRLPHPLVPAVLVCLLAGLTSGDVLDVERAMSLLPFFVLGLTATREQVARLATARVRWTGATLLVLAFGVAVPVAGHLSKEWLYWRAGYDELGVGFWQGAAARLLLLVVAGALAVSALSLVPTSQRWFTPLGGASLVVYLFHGFVVKSALYAGVGHLDDHDPVSAFLVITLGAVLVALGLAATPVAERLNRVVDPISTGALEPAGPVDPGAARRHVQHELVPSYRHAPLRR